MQKNYIANDNIDTNGYRSVLSTDEMLYTSNGGFMTKHRLVAVVSPKGYTSFYLHIRYNGDITSMNEGSILLLKLGNGTNMELRSNKVEPDDFIHVETGLGSTNFLTVRYSITEDQIQQIIDNDVVKVRIQWTGGIFDKEIKNEECLSIF